MATLRAYDYVQIICQKGLCYWLKEIVLVLPAVPTGPPTSTNISPINHPVCISKKRPPPSKLVLRFSVYEIKYLKNEKFKLPCCLN